MIQLPLAMLLLLLLVKLIIFFVFSPYANIHAKGFIAGLVYSVAKTTANKKPDTNKDIIPMSSSSQSNADAVKDHGKP